MFLALPSLATLFLPLQQAQSPGEGILGFFRRDWPLIEVSKEVYYLFRNKLHPSSSQIHQHRPNSQHSSHI